jgi:hypothetical protein
MVLQQPIETTALIRDLHYLRVARQLEAIVINSDKPT